MKKCLLITFFFCCFVSLFSLVPQEDNYVWFEPEPFLSSEEFFYVLLNKEYKSSGDYYSLGYYYRYGEVVEQDYKSSRVFYKGCGNGSRTCSK